MANLACSNILYDKAFKTSRDFTASFTYTMSAIDVPTSNNGFCVFFTDGAQAGLGGGGSGPGLSIVSSTDTTSSSAVYSVFTVVGFDVQGTFSQANSIPAFLTGNGSVTPLVIGLRVTPDFTFVSSAAPTDNTILYPYNTTHTIRVDVRNNFRSIVVSNLVNKNYNELIRFDSSLLVTQNKLPVTAKFGIGFSGDLLFEVQDITLNYS
jgi:hypothetical protein